VINRWVLNRQKSEVGLIKSHACRRHARCHRPRGNLGIPPATEAARKRLHVLLPRIFGSVTFRSRDFSSRYGPKQSSLAVLELIGLTYFEAEWDGGKVNSTKLALPVKFRYGVHPDITHSGDYVFRGVHLGPPQGRAAAKFLSDNLGLKRVSIVTMDNDYGQATFEGFKSAVDQFGIKVLGEYSYSLKDRQFGSIVASVKRDNPDVIYITGYFFTAAPLVTQLRSAGIRAPIVGSQAFDAEKFIQIAGAAVEGVYIVGGLNRDRDSPELKEYLTEFQKRAGYAGENVGASVYSAVRLMCDAITRAGALEPAKGVRIRAYLKRAVAPASYLQP